MALRAERPPASVEGVRLTAQAVNLSALATVLMSEMG